MLRITSAGSLEPEKSREEKSIQEFPGRLLKKQSRITKEGR